MLKLSDLFILLAVGISFSVSELLRFEGYQTEGLFTAIWVPSILAFGIYFKLSSLLAQRASNHDYRQLVLYRYVCIHHNVHRSRADIFGISLRKTEATAGRQRVAQPMKLTI
jgi:hypothetical protein